MLTIVRASWQASNGSWYKMNDSLVNKVELSEVLLQKAYLLFYNRSTGAAGGENKEPSESVDMQSGDANRSNKQAQNKARCKIDTEYLSRCLQDHHAGKSSALPVVPTHAPLCCGTGKASRLKRQREDDDNDDGCVGTKRVCHTHDDVTSRPEPPPLRTMSQGEPRQGIMKKRKRSKCEDGEDDEGKPKRRQVEWT
uniref:USP domain-containing protein n=1 Tax=Eptatretus burgeri TaxID=7764 RepID=A0A8C4NC19_EPTBU